MSSRLEIGAAMFIAVLGLACSELKVGDGELRCSSATPRCPSPFKCHSDGFCWRGEEAQDASTDATHDAPNDSGSDVPKDAPDASSLDGNPADRFETDGADASPDTRFDASETGGASVVPKVGDPCTSDDDCRPIGAAYFCLKQFDAASLPGGMCTRVCLYDYTVDPPESHDCTGMSTCVGESLGPVDNPISACFPTCKADVPCRTHYNCHFVYKDNMLVEPSVCVPDTLSN